MAEDIAALEAQRVALKAAMRTGALSVRHGDKAVQYRTVEEMKVVLAGLDSEIEAASGTRRKRVFYINSGRGY